MKKKLKLKSWDAELNTRVSDVYTNAHLTITLKLGFKQINPPGRAATGTYPDYGEAGQNSRNIIKWTDASWLTWRTNFVTSAQRYWNEKFWLINNYGEIPFTRKRVKYIPNIWCKFKLVGSDVTTTASTTNHHTIDVVRLASNEAFFGSHSTLYDSKDTNLIEKGEDSRHRPIMQRAHVHEIGHLLSMGHVDVGQSHCRSSGNTNTSACYGVSDWSKKSVMGQGMVLRPKFSLPWRRAIILLSGKGKTRKKKEWQAVMTKEYPRTESEFRTKKHIIKRPRR